MITCSLSQAQRYAHLHPQFARVFALAVDDELRQRAPGRYDLGDGLAVMVDEGQTQPANDRRFESHIKAIDVQVVLAGPERMQLAWTDGLELAEDHLAENDIAFYHPPAHIAAEVVLQPDELVIFYPEDAHRPCCNPADVVVPFRKFVFKVPCNHS